MLHNRIEGTHARLKRLFHDSMGDLCSCWDAMNNMLVLQLMMIKTLFQKNINVVQHGFNTPVYKKLHDFVSREAQDIIFHELQWVDTICTNNFACGYRVTHGLPCASELVEFISIYGSIMLKSIHVHWKMLSICSSEDTYDSWGGLNSNT